MRQARLGLATPFFSRINVEITSSLGVPFSFFVDRAAVAGEKER